MKHRYPLITTALIAVMTVHSANVAGCSSRGGRHAAADQASVPAPFSPPVPRPASDSTPAPLAHIAPACTPPPIRATVPSGYGIPVNWVVLTQDDGLVPGDIIASRPNHVDQVSAQFYQKYQALARAYPVLPSPDWAAARERDGSYQIATDYVNYYRALSENRAAPLPDFQIAQHKGAPLLDAANR